MGKTRDLFKKIRDIKGTFHAKMGKINDRSSKEEKKRSKTSKKQKRLRRTGNNTQKNYTRKVLMTWITTMVWSLT